MEFVLLVLTNVAAWLATTGNTVTTHNAWVFSAASAGVYALARGLAKQNTDGKPWYMTSEFYVSILGAAAAVIGASQGHISDTLSKELLAAIGAAMMIANGLRTPPAEAVNG
jgi:peptidoglycan/LPS O-acetylase OafA/YrhL